MNRPIFLALSLLVSAGGGVAAYFGLADPPVDLQPSTPGTQQTGHINVSGTLLAGSLSATDSSSTAQVIVGNATSTSGANYAGLFKTSSDSGTGCRGVASATSGSASGGTFQSAAPSGAGVRGFATDLTGVNYGVYGKSGSPSGFGIYSQGNMAATGVISGNGSGLTTLNASNISSGSLSASRLPIPLSLSGSSTTHVIKGENSAVTYQSSGLTGKSTSTTGVTYGVYGESSSNSGRGMYGKSTSTTGPTYGGYFESASTSGYGIFAKATSTTGSSFGARFETDSTSGKAVLGYANATSGTTAGGYFSSQSPDGYGVIGIVGATTASTIGVLGGTVSPQGIAVLGADSTGADLSYGGWFETNSTAGRGVYGLAPIALATSTSYGVYGYAPTLAAGYAVYANGDSGASGTKSFRIDHPFDPQNKYLLHYSTESPFPQNSYSGNVVTDRKGYAWVDLPDYFDEINANVKYQLTVVDDADADGFVQVKVSRKIRGNRFQVRTSSPRIEISWRVEADRNDPYVRMKKPRSEVSKPSTERGKYQHPELFGAGQEQGVEFQPEVKRRVEQARPKNHSGRTP